MNKKQIILFIICICLLGIGQLANILDKQYGETIPKIVYQQNHDFNKQIFNDNIKNKHISIYASYPNDIDKYILVEPTLNFIEQAIVKNWKPYLKKDNEVVIALRININGSLMYNFLGNTGIYTAADAARKAVLSPKLIGDDIVQNADYLILVYKFTVSEK